MAYSAGICTFLLFIFAVSANPVVKPGNLQLPLNPLSSLPEITDPSLLQKLNQEDITFIGHFGNKNFYYGSIPKTQAEAKLSCEATGSKLLELDSQDELDFINENAPADYCWSGALASLTATSFRWLTSGQVLPADLSMEGGSNIALAVSVYPGGGRLHPFNNEEKRCYFCYIITVP